MANASRIHETPEEDIRAMNLPGYDAWKLATPPYFDLSEEEEKQMWEDEMRPYWDAQDYEAALQANMAPSNN